MGHPFFDAPTFPWHLPEAKPLHVALFNAIDKPDRIRGRYEECGANLPPITLTDPADVMWRNVLDNLARARLLGRLFDLLLTENVPTVHENIRKVIAAVDVVDRTVLSDDRPPILDRADLRKFVAQVARDANPSKILVVRGEHGSGRTWSKHLLTDVAAARNETILYYRAGAVADVGGLISDLFDRLGAPELLPPGLTSERAYYLKVCSKLAVAAERAKKRCWVVVDDLDEDEDGASLMDPEVRSFLQQFGLVLGNPAISQWFRLVLIAYPQVPLPTKWESEQYCVEETSIDSLNEGHVTVHLDERAGREGRALPKEVRDGIAKRVIAAGNGVPRRKRLRAIHEALNAEISKLGGAS